jgi:hypothetical protein
MFRGCRYLVLTLILGWMLCGVIPASAQIGLSLSLLGLNVNIKLSPDLSAAPSGTTVPVIVRYAQAPAQSETNSILNLGGILGDALSSINAQAAVVPVDSLAALASDPNVLYISMDRPVYARNSRSRLPNTRPSRSMPQRFGLRATTALALASLSSTVA